MIWTVTVGKLRNMQFKHLELTHLYFLLLVNYYLPRKIISNAIAVIIYHLFNYHYSSGCVRLFPSRYR